MNASMQHVSVARGMYHDSVTLLRVSQTAALTPGITAAQIAMATPLNTELAVGMGFSIPEGAGPNDLLIAISGADDAAIGAALAGVEAALQARTGPSPSGPGGAVAPPRTVRAAAAAAQDASLVLLSVPGSAVLGEAMDAIGAGRNVMIFSDNVPIADEVVIKDAAATAGVLVMGPDCGTAIIGGIGLGFANVLSTSGSGLRVGIVAASGTGAQQLMCLLDDAGVAISQVLGVGGRDLSGEVGGRSAITALRMLDADPGTDHIVLISKPPHPETEATVQAVIKTLDTPMTEILLGTDRPDITAGTEQLLRKLGKSLPKWRSWPDRTELPDNPASGVLRGLFCGGTLAGEARLVAAEILGDIKSSGPLRHGLPVLTGLGHVIIDLGDDEFTAGRPHPMIDPTLRLDLLAEQAADPDVTVLLLDVVLGHAADPDPAGRLAPAVQAAIDTAAAVGRSLSVVISLCGTQADPQDREAQAAAFVTAGARVHSSNATAARAAAALAGGTLSGRRSNPIPQTAAAPNDRRVLPTGPMPALPTEPPAVICAGIDLLVEALRAQAVEVTPVDFRPPEQSAATLAALTRVLSDPRRAAANELAAQRMLNVRAELVGIRTAGEAIGLHRGMFAHAGPPIEFARASGPLRGALVGAMIFEGMAADEAEATAKLEAGKFGAGRDIQLFPCHDFDAVGPMAGVISPSMWLMELRDANTGARAWCSLNEGLGKVLRYGAYSAEVITRLRWMTDILGPVLLTTLENGGPIDITAIIGQMVQMGDEGHNRNRAGTLMFLREILPSLVTSGWSEQHVADVVKFIGGNDHFFLNLVMPTGKLMGDAAAGIPGSTVVTAMCRNGTDFGIRVSGTGDEWFTGPALYPNGLFLGAYGPDDANPDIGDSAIAETMGIGGMVMATAPAIVRFVGGSVPDALAVTNRMYEITETENPAFAVPILEFRGSPTGIDVSRVIRTGILPQINTGMAGRVAGTGQVGAGLVTPPMDCFTAAIVGLARRVPTA